MKRILIYGDSNTWGSGAFSGRYDFDKQWANILQDKLGTDYLIIQEGLCGRISGDHITDEENKHKNGRAGFEIALRSACPVDSVIVALGTNDIKARYNLSAEVIFNDLLWLKNRVIEYAKNEEDMINTNPTIFFVGIANYRDTDHYDPIPGLKEELSKLILQRGEMLIELNNLEHSDDGLHYSENDHIKVANEVYKKIMELKL